MKINNSSLNYFPFTEDGSVTLQNTKCNWSHSTNQPEFRSSWKGMQKGRTINLPKMLMGVGISTV